jgi:hypothetical protein
LSKTCGSWVVFPDIPVSSTNKVERHGLAEIVLDVVLNTITLTTWYPHQSVIIEMHSEL